MKNIIIPGLEKRLTVNDIYCIGRNYVEHARELNNPVPKSPVVFLKPVSSVIYSGFSIVLPPDSNNVQYETEVVVAIGKEGKNIRVENAFEFVDGYGIGIDVTARDLQQEAKDKSLPWTISKGFDTFAPISNFVLPDLVDDPGNLSFSLEINDVVCQKGNTADMIFPISVLISRLSDYFTLLPGDLVFTGTPAGVGQLNEGDQLTATLGDKLSQLKVSVVAG